MAQDFDNDIETKFNNIKEKVGEKEIKEFLKSYSKGIIAQIIDLLDEGNPNIERDEISWALIKTDENGETTEQLIQGLHEDFYEFENEIEP